MGKANGLSDRKSGFIFESDKSIQFLNFSPHHEVKYTSRVRLLRVLTRKLRVPSRPVLEGSVCHKVMFQFSYMYGLKSD